MHGTHLTAPTQIHKLHSLPVMSNHKNMAPIASASAAAPRLIRFNCRSPFASCCLRPFQLLSCSPIASTSAADCGVPFALQLQLPDCVRFDYCSPIAPAVPEDSSPCPTFFAELEVEVRRSRVTSLVPPRAPRTSHFASVTHTRG